MKNEPTVSRPVRIVVIGAGNRANKYLEYARRYPDRLQPVAVVDVNDPVSYTHLTLPTIA